MPAGLPIWNNSRERFTGGPTPAESSGSTSNTDTGNAFSNAQGELATSQARLDSAKALADSMSKSLSDLSTALDGMNLENLLNGLADIQNGVGGLAQRIDALRAFMQICCGKVDSLVTGQAKLITKTTGIEIASGSANNSLMTKLGFALVIAILILCLVIIFMISRDCRRR